MKKLILSLMAIIVISCSAMAQEESYNLDYTSQGRFIVGGSSSFSMTSNKNKVKYDDEEFDGQKTFGISLSPAVGYFVTDNLALGMQLSISYAKTEDDSPNSYTEDFESKVTSFLAMPFVRYYFSENNIKPYLQGSVGFGSSKTDYSYNAFDYYGDMYVVDDESKSSIFVYEFDGGIAIFLNNNFSIDLGVGYASTMSKPKDNDSNVKFINNAFGFSAGFNVFL